MNLEFKKQRVLVACDDLIEYHRKKFHEHVNILCDALHNQILGYRLSWWDIIYSKITGNRILPPGDFVINFKEEIIQNPEKHIRYSYWETSNFSFLGPAFMGYGYKLMDFPVLKANFLMNHWGKLNHWKSIRKNIAVCDSVLITLEQKEIDELNLGGLP